MCNRKIRGCIVLSSLVILCLCFVSAVSFFAPQNTANALSSTTSTTDIGKILIEDYENNSKKFDAEQLDKLYAQITGIPNATYNDVSSAAKEKRDSEFFFNKNGNKAITLTIDGIVWQAVYLSNNRDKDPILTLWQASSTQTAQWNYHSDSGDANTKIPSNMYSTSMIRTITLNASGRYYTSNDGSGETPVSQDASNAYAKFTMSSVTGSLTDFIDKPANVEWQEKQISHLVNNSAYDFNNDAYGDVGSGGGDFNANWNSGMVNYYGKTDYSAWKNDYIWLPSMTEAGWYEGSFTARGLWNTIALERGNASGDDSWLRSASSGSYSRSDTILADGFGSNNPSTTEFFAVRPAFHLNLKKVEDATLRPFTEPKNISSTYNGEVQTLETLKSDIDWYNSAFADPSIVEVKYLTSTGSELSGDNLPKNKGNYKIQLKILQPKDYSWGDSTGESDVTRIIDFEIVAKKLSVDFKVDNTASPPTATAKPTNLCNGDSGLLNSILRIHYTGTTGTTSYDSYEAPSQVGSYTAKVEIDSSVTGSSNYELDKTYSSAIKIDPQVISMPEIEPEEGSTLWYTYNGDNQYYIVTGYNSSQMEITIADEYVGLFEWDADGESIIVKNAGEYKDALKVTLKNAYNSVTGEGLNVWDATSKDTQDKYLSFTVNKAEIKLDVYTADNKTSNVLNGVIGNSSLDVMIELSSKPLESIGITLTAQATTGSAEPTPISSFNVSSLTTTTSLDISSFKTVRTYAIGVKTDSENYTVTMSRDITLSMKRVNNPNLIWLLRDTNGIPYEVEVDPSTKDVEFDGAKFVYNGKAYSIEVSEPSGYSVQGTIETVLEGTTTALNEIKNAGTYITTVKLVKDGETTSTAYTIKWTVEKAVIDLSNVKWKYDGKLPYNGGAEVKAELEEGSIPEQLEPKYDGNKGGTSVGGSDGSGTVNVTFALKEGYR
ncbi:MAG: hypothetical protein K2J89_01980, partial [Clostridia bacterium]|nr:hypothetical protein [Clostridia bacterium]